MKYVFLTVNSFVLVFFSMISFGQSQAELKIEPYNDFPVLNKEKPPVLQTMEAERVSIPIAPGQQVDKIELKKVPESEVKNKVPPPPAIRKEY